MFPHNKEYPDDFRAYYTGRIRKAAADPKHAALVSYVADDEGQETVTGYADWQRQSAKGEHSEDQTDADGECLHACQVFYCIAMGGNTIIVANRKIARQETHTEPGSRPCYDGRSCSFGAIHETLLDWRTC